MKRRIKVWTGVGAYVLSSVGGLAIAVESAQAETASLLAESVLTSQAPQETDTCRAVAVTGGGEGEAEPLSPLEGGEGGEGGEGLAAPPAPSQSANPAAATAKFNDQQILSDFVDQLIIPNYQSLTQQSAALSTAVTTFASNPNESTLQAARQAWLATRSPWEQSEAFAFGPAASLGYDADLDDWPLNETDVKAVLNSSNPLTVEYVSSLQTSQKGFHAIAFLLFGTDDDKALSDFTPRELEYLQSAAAVFDQTAQKLLASWTEGVNGNPPYRDEFVQAGNGSAAYPTMQAAAEEIVQGIMGILDELGNTKIGEAFTAQNPFLLESRFSHSSLRDFKFNLTSAQNAYLGEFPDARTSGKSLSQFVTAVDPNLDAEIRQQMQTAFAALESVPEPIEETLCDQQAGPKIKAAQDSVLALFTTFEQRVLPLVQ